MERAKRVSVLASAAAIAAFVIGALGFGASQAMASSRMASSCGYDPPVELGTCTSQMDCDLACYVYWGQGNGGYCTGPNGTGCCICEH